MKESLRKAFDDIQRAVVHTRDDLSALLFEADGCEPTNKACDIANLVSSKAVSAVGERSAQV